MALTTRIHLTYKAFDDLEFAIIFHVAGTIVDPNDAVVIAIVGYINSITAAICIHIELSIVGAAVGTLTFDADYVNEDKAFFRFKDSTGTAHNYRVPAPISDIFLDDFETIDDVNALVADYTEAVTTYVKGRGGNPVDSFIKGYRKENRKLIKGGSF